LDLGISAYIPRVFQLGLPRWMHPWKCRYVEDWVRVFSRGGIWLWFCRDINAALSFTLSHRRTRARLLPKWSCGRPVRAESRADFSPLPSFSNIFFPSYALAVTCWQCNGSFFATLASAIFAYGCFHTRYVFPSFLCDACPCHAHTSVRSRRRLLRRGM